MGLLCTATFYTGCAVQGTRGNGACGTCYRDRLGVAYPSLNGFPGDYSAQCSEPPIRKLSCGDILLLRRACPYDANMSVSVPIVDHGPGAACHLDVACGITTPAPSYYQRILDLTPVAFAAVGGSPTRGYIEVNVAYPGESL